MEYDRVAKIAFLPLPPHASYRRSALQTMYRKLDEEIENLTEQVAEQELSNAAEHVRDLMLPNPDKKSA